jgi:glucosamine--fructose-6-phosphate aminotransferase (isomerizing)
MCGITGYTGSSEALPVLLDGLAKLEYRGYDSAGIALYSDRTMEIIKRKGKVSELAVSLKERHLPQTTGIGHTRWATHGVPDDLNAHPHSSMNGKVVIVHNGIVENYMQIKSILTGAGYIFKSDTDTEVLANLIEYSMELQENNDTSDALSDALRQVVGAYGIAMLVRGEHGTIYIARRGSPLVAGLGNKECFISSDPHTIGDKAERMIYLNDNEIATITSETFSIRNIYNAPVTLKISPVEFQAAVYDKGDYKHYMLREICEQPVTITDTLRGRIDPHTGEIVLGGIKDHIKNIASARKIIITGCGTSYHAALIGKYLVEEYAGIPAEAEYASEFRYRKPVLGSGDVVIALSQSGETADTLAAVRYATEIGALVIGICNVAGSTLSRETKAGIYTHAGLEIGVASTKAFTAQVTAITMLAFALAQQRKNMSEESIKELTTELLRIPSKIESIIEEKGYDAIAEKYRYSHNALYLGRGTLYPIALEGALKLKEISYIHAEGYPAGEMKHGPIALVDDNIPVVVIAPTDSYYEKIIGNIREVKARRGNIIAIVNKGDTGVASIADDIIEIPSCHPALTPLLAVIPLQIIAYKIALLRGCNVDQPRNLAKSVTVE